MKILTLFLLLAVLPITCSAGSRGLDIAFLDATPSHTTKEGKRLAELLVKDMKFLYTSGEHARLFPWSDSVLTLKVLTPVNSGMSFDRLLNTKDDKKINALLQKHRAQDGLVVFYYDRANGCARLKLYDLHGNERLLLRLPLEGKTSAMKHSLMKHARRGALIAVGAAIRWSV